MVNALQTTRRLSARSRVSAALAGLLVLVPVWSARAAPGQVGGVPLVEVRVDTSTLSETTAERLGQDLDIRVVARLVGLGIDVSGDASSNADAAELLASVELRDADLLDYAIHLELVIGGEREVIIDELSCTGCTEVDIVDRVVELLPAVAARVRAEAKREVRVPVIERVQRLGPAGIFGISAFTGGVATIVTGGVLLYSADRVVVVPSRYTPFTAAELANPEASESDENLCVPENECAYLRPAHWAATGTALMVVGSVAAVAGFVAAAVDLTVLDRKRRALVSVGVTPSSALVQLTGRF